jgi:filamentous hemagglutinin family protein
LHFTILFIGFFKTKKSPNYIKSNRHKTRNNNQMNSQIKAKIQLISGVILASTTVAIPVNAQTITPAADGTGTLVNQQDNIINITGGQTSADGANLFHSFDQFGVNTGQTANFQSSPEINNILGRVVGGNASIINGILQVTGGNSNLFLMNPAGILFGPNASLNVPADFTATTATSIGFGNNNWFNSIGDNNWANLVGNPSYFNFDLAQPGWVVNFADLTLNSGQNLTLLGGGILNSGNLTVPGGNITIAAVPGESLIRISQPGNILSLDIATPGLNQGVINPLSLPELLTGGSQIIDATQVQQNADGTITLTSSGVTIDPNSQTGLVLAAGDVTTATSGQVNVLTGGGNIILDQVNSNKVNINAKGGNITQVDSDSLINASAVQLQTEGEGGIGLETQPLRLEADNLEANAGSGGAFFAVPNGDINIGGVIDELTGMSITNGGDFSLESVGSITVIENISTSDDIHSGDITLTSNAGAINTSDGSLNTTYTSTSSDEGYAGFITLTAEQDIYTGSISISMPDYAWGFTGDITLISNAGVINTTGGSLNILADLGHLGSVSLTADGNIYTGSIQSWAISLWSKNGAIDTTAGLLSVHSPGLASSGSVTLDAAGNIDTGSISSFAAHSTGNITLTSDGVIDSTGGSINISDGEDAGSVTFDAAGDIYTGKISLYGDLSSGDITLNSGGVIDTTGGEIDISADSGTSGSVTLTAVGDIRTNDISLSLVNDNAGSITLNSGGAIDTTDGVIDTGSHSSGSVTLTAEGNIKTGDIFTSPHFWGGNITLISNSAAIDTTGGSLNASSYESAGSITLTAQGNISTSDIGSSSYQGTGGNISLESTSGAIDTSAGQLDSHSEEGSGGHIEISASGDILTGFVSSYSQSLSADSYSGNIWITSHNGTIDTSGGQLDSHSQEGSAGHIEISASGDIRTGFVSSYNRSSSPESHSGDIWITSHNGSINTTIANLSGEAQISPNDDVSSVEVASIFNNAQANLESDAHSGMGGNVILKANGDITTSHISTFGSQGSGNVTISSDNGVINTRAIFSFSQAGNAGNVTLKAANDINTSHISAWGNQQGGNITIDAGNIVGQLNNDTPCNCVNILGTESASFNIGSATIHSFSQVGHGGNVRITTLGDTNLGGDENRHAIRSAGYSKGGDISIFSLGHINSVGDIETFSDTGIGGDVSLKANGSVILRNIRTFGPLESGDLVILSCENLVNTGLVETVAPNGTSGNIQINTYGTEGNIQTANLTSAGKDGSGNITVVAEDGSVITQNIASIATEGDSGDINVDGQDDVITEDITSQGDKNSGNISVNSNAGSTTTGNVATVAENGNSGDVTVTDQNDVQTGNITSQAGQNSGDILVNSNAGSVTTVDVATIAQNGNSGDVTVTAQNDVQTGNITSQSGQNSGDILVNSNAGSVTTGNIATIAENGSSGNIAVRANNDIYTLNITSLGEIDSGDISVTSDTGNINTANLETVAETGNSGDVDLTANQDITTGDISSIGGTNSGDIAATSTEGAIATGNIETRADQGIAGDVTLNAQDDINTGSITSTGAISSGDITVNSTEGVVKTGEISTDTGEINIHQDGLNDLKENAANLGILNNLSPNIIELTPILNSENSDNFTENDSHKQVQQILETIPVSTSNSLQNSIDDRISSIEESRTSEFADSFGISAENQVITTASAREVLGSMAEQTGTHSAVVYVTSYDDQLELIMFTAEGEPIRAAVPEANRQVLSEQVQEFRNEITHPAKRRSNSYLAPAQQLYQWLIAPIESEL